MARHDADLWLLPDLRREDWIVCGGDPATRFRDVWSLVCRGGAAFAATDDGYAGGVLRQRWAIYFARAAADRAASITFHRGRGVDLVRSEERRVGKECRSRW